MVLIVLLFLFAGPAHLFGQTTSTIQGTVADAQGKAIPGAHVQIKSVSLGIERTVTTNSEGFYQVTALPVSVYEVTVSNAGFSEQHLTNVELTLNRTVALDVVLQIGQVQTQVTVSGAAIQIDPTETATGQTITPSDVEKLPINGRNYLDLLQVVPGVAINRQQPSLFSLQTAVTGSGPGSDGSTPVLGERAGNINYMIDGLPNKGTFAGGASLNFNQDAIAEFQVLTSSYKAEFGQSTAGVINVITKSGTNEFHGSANLFVRNSGLDSANSPVGVPALHRYDYDLNLGGPIVKDRVFFFGSSERIQEHRVLGFQIANSAGIPPELIASEKQFNTPRLDNEVRHVVKIDEQFGRHHVTEQMSYNNLQLNNDGPLIGQSLPSTRTIAGLSALLTGATDTVLLGDTSHPWVAVFSGSYRRTPVAVLPAHPNAGPFTSTINFDPGPACNVISQCATPYAFGANAGNANFGSSATPATVLPWFAAAKAAASKQFSRFNIKFGWEFLRTHADGTESQTRRNQLFVTDCPPPNGCVQPTPVAGFTPLPANNFATYGPIYSGFFANSITGPLTAQDAIIRLRNNYTGLYSQGDLKVRSNLTLNVGLRWDYDSNFPNKTNFSPRAGASWSVTPKTIIRGSFGVFYDQFRLETAKDIPAFGGANENNVFHGNLPQLFYNVPTLAPALSGLCFTSLQSDKQVTSGGSRPGCPFFGGGVPVPFFGRDFLNTLPGQTAIPAGTVVTTANVQQLTGLTPAQFLSNVNSNIASAYTTFGGSVAPLTMFWEPVFGDLAFNVFGPPSPVPIGIDSQFRTPHTLAVTVGVQRQFGQDTLFEANYYHRDIRDILGVRDTNLPFSDRLLTNPQWIDPATGKLGYSGPVRTFGPWYSGIYDGFTITATKRMSKYYSFQASYGYAHATDDNLNGVGGVPSDSWRSSDIPSGVVPLVADPKTGQTNQNGSFVSSAQHYVPKAGIHYNGQSLDKGRSDLALTHTFVLNGLVQLPYHFQLTGLFRTQSGFPYTRKALNPLIVDGSGTASGLDIVPSPGENDPGGTGRNHFIAPLYSNLDARLAKQFTITERVHMELLLEAFNLLNRPTPAAVNINQGDPSFGSILQWLPGREAQAGFRITF